LTKVKQSRDQKLVQKCLDALTSCAKTRKGNLLELSIEAAKARCTVGEISEALEKIWGRHQPSTTVVSGAYTSAYGSDTEEIKKTIQMAKVY